MNPANKNETMEPQNQVKTLQLNSPTQHSAQLTISLPDGTNAKQEVVTSIRNGMLAPIRTMDQRALDETGSMELQAVSLAYCGAAIVTVPPIVWSECISLLQNQFPNIGIYEIRQAFELAAASKLDVNIVAYRGQFTVDILGKVLSAYSEYRKAIHAALVNEQRKDFEQDLQEERVRRMTNLLEHNQSKWYALMQSNNRFERWQQINTADYKVVDGLGMIKPDKDEKIKIWLGAKAEAKKAFFDGDEFMLSSSDILKIKQAMTKDPGHFPDELKPKAITIYEKMLVFHSLPGFQMPF